MPKFLLLPKKLTKVFGAASLKNLLMLIYSKLHEKNHVITFTNNAKWEFIQIFAPLKKKANLALFSLTFGMDSLVLFFVV